MKQIVIAYFICLLVLYWPAALTFDPNALNQQFASSVSVPYRQAVETLAERILKPLAESPVPQSSETAAPLVNNLKTNVGQFTGQLQTAKNGLDSIIQQTVNTIESITAQHSAAQNQLTGVESQLSQVNTQIQSTDQQITAAQNQVNQAEEALRRANDAVAEAERKVDRARNCIVRGKRGIFRKIGKFLKKVVNAPCHLVNNGGIRRAKNARSDAQRHRDQMVSRLQQLRNTRNDLQNRKNALEQQRNQITQSKNQLHAQLGLLQERRNLATTMDAMFKKVLVHVGTLHGKSEILQQLVSKLIDLETLITPLNVIGGQVTSYSGGGQLNNNDIQRFQAQLQSINTSINVIKQKLPQYPLNINVPA